MFRNGFGRWYRASRLRWWRCRFHIRFHFQKPFCHRRFWIYKGRSTLVPIVPKITARWRHMEFLDFLCKISSKWKLECKQSFTNFFLCKILLFGVIIKTPSSEQNCHEVNQSWTLPIWCLVRQRWPIHSTNLCFLTQLLSREFGHYRWRIFGLPIPWCLRSETRLNLEVRKWHDPWTGSEQPRPGLANLWPLHIVWASNWFPWRITKATKLFKSTKLYGMFQRVLDSKIVKKWIKVEHYQFENGGDDEVLFNLLDFRPWRPNVA